MTNRPDHAHYLHAVADALKAAGFSILSSGGHDWTPRGGHILLEAQDGWDDYRYADADVRWNERDGWTCMWGGITHELNAAVLASPACVVMAVGHLLGPTPQLPGDADWTSPRVTVGTAGFDAALAAYVP